MKKLLLGLMLVPAVSFAYLPTGCYVQDGSSFCYSLSFLATDCDQANMNSFNYGSYISSACSYVNFVEGQFLSCSDTLLACDKGFTDTKAQRDDCVIKYSNLSSEYISLESNRQEWIAFSNSQKATLGKNAALVKKLRKACGTKCKKIK